MRWCDDDDLFDLEDGVRRLTNYALGVVDSWCEKETWKAHWQRSDDDIVAKVD